MLQKYKLLAAELFLGKLAQASSLLISGTVVSGMLGYVFQILMGRILGVDGYASLSTLLAVYTLFTTPLATLMMVISKKVSEYQAQNDVKSLSHFFLSNIAYSGLLGIFVLIIFFVFLSEIQKYLKLNNPMPVFLLALLIVVTFFPTINNAFMQGMEKFKAYSILGFLSVFFKIILSGIFVWAGYGVTGAIGGIIISYLIILILGYFCLSRIFIGPNKNLNIRSHLKFSGVFPVFIANLAFIMMTQLDILVVNYFFTAKEAGAYAAASVLGKAVMYLPGGISLAMFPMVAKNNTIKISSSHLLLQAIKLTSLLCILGGVFYFFYGEYIIIRLYGVNYAEAGIVLKYYGLAIFPMALVMVAEQFLIAKGRILFAYLFAVIAPLQLLAIYYFHQTLLMIVSIIAISGFLTAALGYGMLWRSLRKTG